MAPDSWLFFHDFLRCFRRLTGVSHGRSGTFLALRVDMRPRRLVKYQLSARRRHTPAGTDSNRQTWFDQNEPYLTGLQSQISCDVHEFKGFALGQRLDLLLESC